jgi:hypothetical protein
MRLAATSCASSQECEVAQRIWFDPLQGPSHAALTRRLSQHLACHVILQAGSTCRDSPSSITAAALHRDSNSLDQASDYGKRLRVIVTMPGALPTHADHERAAVHAKQLRRTLRAATPRSGVVNCGSLSWPRRSRWPRALNPRREAHYCRCNRGGAPDCADSFRGSTIPAAPVDRSETHAAPTHRAREHRRHA